MNWDYQLQEDGKDEHFKKIKNPHILLKQTQESSEKREERRLTRNFGTQRKA